MTGTSGIDVTKSNFKWLGLGISAPSCCLPARPDSYMMIVTTNEGLS
jgi:hypothetical protein